MTPSRVRSAAFVVLATLLTIAPAAAQSGAYIEAVGFADIRQFSTTDATYLGDEFSLDATGAGGGIRVGTWLHPRWTLELGAEVASRTEVDYESPIRILIFPPPPPQRYEASTEFVTVTTTVGFHPPAMGRLQLGYRAGISLVRATYRSEFPIFAVPATIFSREPLPGLSGISRNVSSVILPRTPTTLTRTHNAAALALGIEGAVSLSSHFSIVPEARALVFSGPDGGPTVFLIRPGVSARWRF